MIIFCNEFVIDELSKSLADKGRKGIIFSMHPVTKSKNAFYDLNPFYLLASNIIHNASNRTQIAGNGITYVDPNTMNYVLDSVEFDMIFANTILNNDQMLWLLLMNVMINAFNGYDILIETGIDEFSNKVVESLIKMIQETYQYNCFKCMYNEDIQYIISMEEPTFGPNGLLKLDFDKAKYQQMVMSGNIDYIIGEIPNDLFEI